MSHQNFFPSFLCCKERTLCFLCCLCVLNRLEDGFILDEKPFFKDYINLVHNAGVCLYDDLLAVLSLRYQTIHVLQIRDSGNLVHVRAIGAHCREDDELFLNSYAQVILFLWCIEIVMLSKC